MKRAFVFVALLALSFSVFAQDKYQFYLNLTAINSDMLKIELKTPKINQDKIIYNMPKIVPGTYSIYNFGQYVMDFQAFDANGYALSVTRLDQNRWEITGATKLTKITYWVEDTWDASVDNVVFEPGGTNIEKDENVVLNNHGFFGYFDGLKKIPYEVNITRQDDFYGSTGMSSIKTDGNIDTYTTSNYMDLVDSPIMYNKPDTTVIKIGLTDVLISVYSKSKVATAKELAKDIRKILEQQKNYLGGKLPVDKYAFIIYLYAGQSGSGGSGALEHSYSSFYYLPEMPAEQLSGFVVDVAAHEFFHVVTPLSIHSKEIGDFDYINPKISKHLWLYEGVTEYFAGHVQVYEGMQTPEEYLDVIVSKMRGASGFNDKLPFTELSLGCLDEHKDQYGNVYQKGALIGLCLDILLREKSNGKIGVKDMMAKLSETYGKDVSFNDDELFDKITELTFPATKTFFTQYVEGNEPLPFEEYFKKVGIIFKKNAITKEVSLGGVMMNYNPETQRLFIADLGDADEFAKAIGYQTNDEIVSLNGKKVEINEAQKIIDDFKKNTKAGDKVEIIVARKSGDKYKEKKLKAKAIIVEKKKQYLLEFDDNATPQQLAIRKAWLGL